jgi:DnaJ-class molecular chaperone
MHSAWQKPHDLTDDACPECQGSCYVPAAPIHDGRIVDECRECEGTGKAITKKAA